MKRKLLLSVMAAATAVVTFCGGSRPALAKVDPDGCVGEASPVNDGNRVGTGVYFARLQAGTARTAARLIVID